MPRRPIPKTPLALLLLALLLLALLLCDVALVLDHAGQPSDLRMMDLCLGTALGILLAVVLLERRRTTGERELQVVDCDVRWCLRRSA